MSAFPAELLLKIFGNLQKESPDSLRAVSASSREFSRVARPIVYSELRFSAYKPKNGTMSKKAFQRMDLWTSETVAPLVRTCIISRGVWGINASEASLNGLLAVFLESIGRFSGLRSLVIRDVALERHLSEIFHLLPRLEELDVELVYAKEPALFEPKVVAGTGLRSCKLKLGLKDGLQAFLPFFRPESLVQLSLECKLQSWAKQAGDIPTFPKVSVLCLGGGAAEDTIALLPKFPAVRELTFAVRDLDISDFSARVFGPMLQTVKKADVPGVLVPFFLQNAPNLTHVKLSDAELSSETILTMLQQSESRNVVSVELYLNMPDAAILSALIAAFPQLEELHFQAYDGGMLCDYGGAQFGDARKSFLDFLAGLGEHATATLPATLKSLMITWYSDEGLDDEENWRWMVELPEPWGDGPREGEPHTRAEVPAYLRSTRDAILARLPALTSLWLDYPPVLVTWRREAPNAPVLHESFVYRPGQPVPQIGPKEFWASR
ncbi:hypothetical protein MKEN_00464800 [Mycena kentingensis (nom. inval.)]|nr:hypothetical protein MKEN_00464800 [Mycena kentingensis (nom. inval.)]